MFTTYALRFLNLRSQTSKREYVTNYEAICGEMLKISVENTLYFLTKLVCRTYHETWYIT